jgi:hypothetical protein
MDLIDQINSHQGLFLKHLVQANDMELVLFLSEARVNSDKIHEVKFNEGTEHFVSLKTNPIETDDSSKKYKVTFKNFIVYQVIEESSIHWSDKDVSTGTLFREFSESRFLDHISEHLNVEFWEAVDGRKSRHFQFPCLNYIVDVLSRNEPVIEETMSL